MIILLVYAIKEMESIKVNHNDLHSDNIFYKTLDEDKTFDIDGVSLNLQAGDIIPLIGDFGMAAKYDNPVILNSSINKHFLPDYFNTVYDTMFSLSVLYQKKPTPFLEKILRYVFMLRDDEDTNSIYVKQRDYFRGFNADVRSLNVHYRGISAKSTLNFIKSIISH
jgi:hypothetical protein